MYRIEVCLKKRFDISAREVVFERYESSARENSSSPENENASPSVTGSKSAIPGMSRKTPAQLFTSQVPPAAENPSIQSPLTVSPVETSQSAFTPESLHDGLFLVQVGVAPPPQAPRSATSKRSRECKIVLCNNQTTYILTRNRMLQLYVIPVEFKMCTCRTIKLDVLEIK